MSDHHKFVSSLSAEDRNQLTQTSNAKGLARLLGYLALLVGCFAGYAAGGTIFVLPLGILLIFLFTLLHECSHSTVFRTGFLNRLTSVICGFILFLPATWFRFFHFAHHRYTHDPDKDPELAEPKPTTWGGYLYLLTGIPVWIGQFRTLFTNALGRNNDGFVPNRQRNWIRTEAQIHILGYVLFLTLFPMWAVTFWLIPLIIGQPFLRLYLLAEHTGCPHEADMFANTRTTFTTRIIRFIAWNMPYHAEHHAYPSVPFHQLPALHARTREYLKVTADGYTRFHRDYQTRLKP